MRRPRMAGNEASFCQRHCVVPRRTAERQNKRRVFEHMDVASQASGTRIEMSQTGEKMDPGLRRDDDGERRCKLTSAKRW